MRFFADLHIHSSYSLATARNVTPELLSCWAKIKGINLLGTGDCTHPLWLKDLEKALVQKDDGFYYVNPALSGRGSEADRKIYTETPSLHQEQGRAGKGWAGTAFVLTGELSCIYRKNGKTRKIHLVPVLPDIKAAKKLQKQLAGRFNISSDGRPILGFDAKDLLEMILNLDDRAFVIPAHIWTPHFSLYGAYSGFDTMEECFEGLSKEIFAMETGLSSDPKMNRLCSFLDDITLVSNSDAHSPNKIAREANIFDTEFSYDGMLRALKTRKGFTGTVEFFPQEGKYYYDGHRKCGIVYEPEETFKRKGRCPVCGGELVTGVYNRVKLLADRKKSAVKNEVYYATPLDLVVSEYLGCGRASKKAVEMYMRVIETLGPEIDVLLFTALDKIEKAFGEKFAGGIRNLRGGRVKIKEGFDGQFGSIKVF